MNHTKEVNTLTLECIQMKDSGRECTLRSFIRLFSEESLTGSCLFRGSSAGIGQRMDDE